LYGGCPDKPIAGCPDKALAGCPDKLLAGCPDKAAAGCPVKVLAGCPDKVFAGCPDKALAGYPDKALAGRPDKSAAGCPDKAAAGCLDKVLASCPDKVLAGRSSILECLDRSTGCQEKNANSVSYRENRVRSTGEHAHSKRTCRGNSDLSQNIGVLDRRRLEKSTQVNCSTSDSKPHIMNRYVLSVCKHERHI
jgi:hypothetical protein